MLLVTPAVYALMKKSPDIVMDTDFSAELRLKGVIAQLDGAQIVKVPAKRLPENFGFMMAHPVATVAPTKLEDFKCHIDLLVSAALWWRGVSAMMLLYWRTKQRQSIIRPFRRRLL